MLHAKVASVSVIDPGTMKKFKVAGKDIVIYNCNGKFYATTNVCVHMGGPLGDGELNCPRVTCPWHGWRYDVRSGKGEPPADPGAEIAAYKVTVKENEIWVDVP